jgi:hypothetical protein
MTTTSYNVNLQSIRYVNFGRTLVFVTMFDARKK